MAAPKTTTKSKATVRAAMACSQIANPTSVAPNTNWGK
jgi:hypothetical protein